MEWGWNNMLSAWQWGVLAALGPLVVLLYFLRLRREPQIVSSTYLWRRSLEDLRVNALWQRLRQSVLLWLQLLLMALIALALLRPSWRAPQEQGRRLVFLIDHSASMNATDVAPSRLAQAKTEAKGVVEQMQAGDWGMVMSFADGVQIEQPFSANRHELLTAIERIVPTHRTANVDDAVAMLAVTASEQPPESENNGPPPGAMVYLFSDGGFSHSSQQPLRGVNVLFRPIGSDQPANFAIGAFELGQPNPETGAAQAFVRVDSFANETAERQVELLHDEQLLDLKGIRLEPGKSAGITFDLPPDTSGVLTARLSETDALADDNQAWVVREEPPLRQVLLVTPGNEPVESALGELSPGLVNLQVVGPEFLKTPAYERAAAEGEYGLVIFDRCVPTELPSANALFVAALPTGDKWKFQQQVDHAAVLDVHLTHPLTRWCEMGNVHLGTITPVVPPSGSTPLIETDRGLLLAVASRGLFQDAVLGCSCLTQVAEGDGQSVTDWPLRQSFPVFWLNALNYLGTSQEAMQRQFSPGSRVLLPATVVKQGKFEVQSPAGNRVEVELRAGNSASFSQTEQLGVYQVSAAGKVVERFAVQMRESAESQLQKRENADIGGESAVAPASWQGGRRNLWKGLLLVGLVALLVEWYIYHQRVYG